MWLAPVFSTLSTLATRVYYKMEVSGESIPSSGPVLMVANHPNSLIDPAMVAAVARRPVRFLAKAPLFYDAKVGWLIKAVGSIPVYRRADDPSAMTANTNMFSAVHAELAAGSAVGIFPEGLSHSDPSLAELKTGAARIALGAAHSTGSPIPIIPVGLIYREKDLFRSSVLALIGPPVEWDDLAGISDEDREAVQDLTQRIASSLAAVTINLQRWDDAGVIECARDIWVAETAGETDPARQIALAQRFAEGLADYGATDAGKELIRDTRAHRRRLKAVGLSPTALRTPDSLRTSARWTLRRLYLVALPAVFVGLVGSLLFLVPYRLTHALATVARQPKDRLSTYKLMIGIPVYTVWILALAAFVAAVRGPALGLLTLAAMPAIGFAGQQVREGWSASGTDLRSFFTRRQRQALMAQLGDDQARLKRRYELARERR